jgi:chemotaxis protein CheZ
MTDDLEALFDEIANEEGVYASESTTQASLEPPSEKEPDDADLEALFDEIATGEGVFAKSDSAPTPEASLAEEASDEADLEALFDELSAGAQLAVAELTPAEIQVAAEPVAKEVVADADQDEVDLESLFDTLSVETGAWVPGALDVSSAGLSSHDSAVVEAAQEKPSVDMTGKPLYESIGALVRQLHDSMRELGYDRALQDAATDVIDAKSRLEYVATLTEQAATRVLNSIDIAMPHQDELAKTAADLEGRWAELFEGEMDIERFKQLALDSQAFAANTARRAEEEKNLLMEIMMAQDFQDITGQIIKKVVGITKKLEEELVQLLRDNAPDEVKEKEIDLMSGPDVPEKALQQDDVDNLLARLGF